MNNKLVFVVLCALSIFGAGYAGESSGSGSSSQSGVAAEAQLCTICQNPIEFGQPVADGREIFGCTAPHFFHKVCLCDERGELQTVRCPLCRATKKPMAARAEAGALCRYVVNRDFFNFEEGLTREVLRVVLRSDATVARPAIVPWAVWLIAIDSLNESGNKRLDLFHANLTSEQLEVLLSVIPNSIKSTITEVNLQFNLLTVLPELEHFTRLTLLDISHNQLTALPALEHLTQLTSLNISNNQLTALPALEHLTKLTSLNISNNQLTALPGLEHLVQLTKLGVSNNKLTALPELEHLAKLEALDLSHNQLTALPRLDDLTLLRGLVASDNQLTVLLGLEHLIQLRTLIVAHNQLTALPGLEHLVQLTHLDVNNNSLGQPVSLMQHILRFFWGTWPTILPGLENLVNLSNLKIDRGITVPVAVAERLGRGLQVEREGH